MVGDGGVGKSCFITQFVVRDSLLHCLCLASAPGLTCSVRVLIMRRWPTLEKRGMPGKNCHVRVYRRGVDP